MEAPNKIYLEQTGEVTFNAMWFDKPTDKGFQHEYIHKDLLLEWAEDNLLECEASNDETDYGRIDAYKKLIDKLNSL